MSTEYRIEEIAFEGPKEPYKGFTVRASYLEEPNHLDALIEIFKEGSLIRRFLFPAYKVWNIAGHFKDIVDSELEGKTSGYDMAAWDGIQGATVIMPK